MIERGRGTLFKKEPKQGSRGLNEIVSREVMRHGQPEIREAPAKREAGRRGVD